MPANTASKKDVPVRGKESKRRWTPVAKGTRLTDLIQVECLMFKRCCIKVESDEGVGFIYFASGQMVHAECDDLLGAEAVYQLVSWRDSSFFIEEDGVTEEESIHSPWEAIVLEAARRLDETHAILKPKESQGEAAKVIPLPRPETMEEKYISRITKDPNVTDIVHFSEDCCLLGGQGKRQEAMQQTFAFVVEMAKHIGASMGLQNLQEIEIRGMQKKGVCVVLDDESCVCVLTNPKGNLGNLVEEVRKESVNG